MAELILRIAGLRGRRAPRRRRPREVRVGATIVVVIAIAAFLGPLVARYQPNQVNILNNLQAPSSTHWFGTDNAGRDVFTRVLYGARTDFIVVTLVTYASLVIGVLLGSVSAYLGGWFDIVVGRFVDSVIAFPFIVLVLAVIAAVGPGLAGVSIGIVIVDWALYARLARTEMLTIREREYMLATKTLGYSNLRAIVRHAIPNLLRSSIVYSTIDVVGNLLLVASMSYLGLGQQPPGADLGSIIASGQSYLLSAWWIATLPGVVLVLLGFGIALIGDGISEGRL
jgi:peptide/nickel transport system permease protein